MDSARLIAQRDSLIAFIHELIEFRHSDDCEICEEGDRIVAEVHEYLREEHLL